MNLMTDQILNTIPQRPPFLFVDKIIDSGDDWIHCQKHLSGDEDFFKGHFPQNPIMPGVLLQEAAFQSAALLIGIGKGKVTENKIGVVTRVENAKFKIFVRPGDTLMIEVNLKEQIGSAWYMKGVIKVDEKITTVLNFTVALIDDTVQKD